MLMTWLFRMAFPASEVVRIGIRISTYLGGVDLEVHLVRLVVDTEDGAALGPESPITSSVM